MFLIKLIIHIPLVVDKVWTLHRDGRSPVLIQFESPNSINNRRIGQY